MKCCIAWFGHGAIKLAKTICTIGHASKNDHQAKVLWLHLIHVGEGVVDKYKQARGKVIVTYSVGKLLLELADGGMAAGSDAVMDGGEVGRVFLELAGIGG